MALRPIWKGAISFGLVNIPVSLYLAVQSERTSFRLLHQKDHGRIRYKKVCEIEGEEVPADEIVRGYEYEKGAYVEVTDEDLEGIDIGLERAISIERFVDGDAIDSFYFDRPYFLEPGRGAERSYALLSRALVESGKVGIARIVFRDRESLAALRPKGPLLTLETLRFATQVRHAEGLHLPSGEAAEVPRDQLELALLLVDRLVGPWEPELWQDRYEEALERLISRKLEGLPAQPPAPARVAEVVDLAEILRRSLREEGGAPPTEGRARSEGRVEAREPKAAKEAAPKSKRRSKPRSSS